MEFRYSFDRNGTKQSSLCRTSTTQGKLNKKKWSWFSSSKALYLIASNGIPPLYEPERWSDEFKDFLQLCTSMDPAERPDANTLLRVRKKEKTNDISSLTYDISIPLFFHLLEQLKM